MGLGKYTLLTIKVNPKCPTHGKHVINKTITKKNLKALKEIISPLEKLCHSTQ